VDDQQTVPAQETMELAVLLIVMHLVATVLAFALLACYSMPERKWYMAAARAISSVWLPFRLHSCQA
jgi:hypothetical protein